MDLNNLETKDTLKNLDKFKSHYFVVTTYQTQVVDRENWKIIKNIRPNEKADLIQKISEVQSVGLRGNSIHSGISIYSILNQNINIQKIYRNDSGRLLVGAQVELYPNGEDITSDPKKQKAIRQNLFFLGDKNKLIFAGDSDDLIDSGDYIVHTDQKVKPPESEFIFYSKQRNTLILLSANGELYAESGLQIGDKRYCLGDSGDVVKTIHDLQDGFIFGKCGREDSEFISDYFWGKREDYENYVPLDGLPADELESGGLERPILNEKNQIVFTEHLSDCFKIPIISHIYLVEKSRIVESQECVPFTVKDLQVDKKAYPLCAALQRALMGDDDLYQKFLNTPEKIPGLILDGGDSFSRTLGQLELLKRLKCGTSRLQKIQNPR